MINPMVGYELRSKTGTQKCEQAPCFVLHLCPKNWSAFFSLDINEAKAGKMNEKRKKLIIWLRWETKITETTMWNAKSWGTLHYSLSECPCWAWQSVHGCKQVGEFGEHTSMPRPAQPVTRKYGCGIDQGTIIQTCTGPVYLQKRFMARFTVLCSSLSGRYLLVRH